MIHSRPLSLSILDRILPAIVFLLLIPSALATGQVRGIVTIGMSQDVNWMPDTDSIVAFRASNGDAETLATLGSEITIGYEWFLGENLVDTAQSASLQVVAGFLQRGYRVRMEASDSCLLTDVYRSGATWLRVGLYGRDHIPIGGRTYVVGQLGVTYGQFISAFDNVAEVQFCNLPAETVEAVYPKSFVEVGGGIGVRQKISPRLIGSFSLLGYLPVVVASSETRPPTRDNAQSLMVDLATPNLAIQIGVGYMF